MIRIIAHDRGFPQLPARAEKLAAIERAS